MNSNFEEHALTTEHHALMGLASLMTKAFRGEDLKPLGESLIKIAGTDPNASCANALLDLSMVLHLRGDYDIGVSMQEAALKLEQCYLLATKGQPALRLLAIMAPGDISTNTPLEFLVENSDVELIMLFIAPWLPFPEFVPEHDVAFVAICESEKSQQSLKLIENMAKVWPRPMLNSPECIARLSRNSVSSILKSAPGIFIPTAIRVGRQVLEQIACGAFPLSTILKDSNFPIILRPLDSHAGKGLDKANNPAEIVIYLQTRSDSEFYLANFVDYRSIDGQFRKYRVILIDGCPYASHMAISDHWVVHYLNGGMADNAEKRAEEEHFMAQFDEEFAQRHADALQAIATRIGLDYLVIDCAEMPDGRLLVFEVDHTAVVHAMDSIDKFPYKHPQMRKNVAAFRAMLFKAKERGMPQAHGLQQ